MMLPQSDGTDTTKGYMRWGSLVKELLKRYTPQEIEKMTLYQMFVASGLALIPEDGQPKMDADKRALYGI